MTLTSDILFLYIIPIILEGYGFNRSDVTYILTVFFAADLVGKILLGILSSIVQLQNRYVVLIATIIIIVLRTGKLQH